MLTPRITNASWVGSTIGKSSRLTLPIDQIRKSCKDCKKKVQFEEKIMVSGRAAIIAPRLSYASWLGSILEINISSLFVRSGATENIAKK